MRYYDQMSYQEIAAITDTSVGALKTSFHLAVKKIESVQEIVCFAIRMEMHPNESQKG